MGLPPKKRFISGIWKQSSSPQKLTQAVIPKTVRPLWHRILQRVIRHRVVVTSVSVVSVIFAVFALASNFSSIASFLNPTITIGTPSSELWGPGSGEFEIQNNSTLPINIVNATCTVTSYSGAKSLFGTQFDNVKGSYIMIASMKYIPQEVRGGLKISLPCDIMDYVGFNPENINIELEIYYRSSTYNPVEWFTGTLHATQKFTGHKIEGGGVNWIYGSSDLGLFEVNGPGQPCQQIFKLYYPTDRFEHAPHHVLPYMEPVQKADMITCEKNRK